MPEAPESYFLWSVAMLKLLAAADELFWVGKGDIPDGQEKPVNAKVGELTWACGGDGAVYVAKDGYVFLLVPTKAPRGFGFFEGEYPLYKAATLHLEGADKAFHNCLLPKKGTEDYSWFVAAKPFKPKDGELKKAREAFTALAKIHKIEVNEGDLASDKPALVTEIKIE